MKTQLIMLDTPIIVSDEKIKIEDWYLDDTNQIRQSHTNDDQYWSSRKEYQKIIAGIEGLPSIDWNGLEEKFGWVDVEKLTGIYVTEQYNKSDNPKYFDGHRCRKSFFDGFKKAQSINEKKFSLEDLTNMFILGGKHKIQNPNTFLDKMREIIQSLQQPKVFDIEVELEMNGLFPMIPKVTNNSIKILRKL